MLYSNSCKFVNVAFNRILGKCKFEPLCNGSATAAASASKESEHSSWEPMIGLEIHAQIASQSKLFSGSAVASRQAANCSVSYFDAALPGTLPVLNKRCVEAGVMTALALQCEINRVSKFERKHYFYFDLPAGYQITQQSHPLARNGRINFYVINKEKPELTYLKSSRVLQLQLEQDSGKSVHIPALDQVLLNLNRAGIGLMEIITEPNLSNGDEAECLVRELHLLLHSIEGHLRVDANVSVRKRGSTDMSTRTEVKNINSFRHVRKAVDFEIRRQLSEVEKGNVVQNETRLFDYKSGETVPIRDKEKLHDYRYLREPCLPPLRLYDDQHPPLAKLHADQIVNVDRLRESLTELPVEKITRWVRKGADPFHTAACMYRSAVWAALLVQCLDRFHSDVNATPPVLNVDYQSALASHKLHIESSPLSAKCLSEAVGFYANRQITHSALKVLLAELLRDPSKTACQIVEERRWTTISQSAADMCQSIVEKETKAVRDYKAAQSVQRKEKILQFFVRKAREQCNMAVDDAVLEDNFRQILNS